jgi:hypothetical protein
VVIDDFNL